ncbi:hypothetical protein QA597_04150 [Marinilabiliaceae bacterium ANBcel2]|nr:hypothetical protein [Marinilabiliaceae bacterium ANBcel2]
MDSLGDILYLLIMVAVLVISVIKKPKSDEDVVVPESENDEFPPFDDWLDQPKEKNKKKDSDSSERMEPEKMKPEKLEYKRPEYKNITKQKSFKQRDRNPSIMRHPSRKKSLVTEDDITAKSDLWDSEEIDLKKAVIYSEIIKRPDF